MAEKWAKQLYNSKDWQKLRVRLLMEVQYKCSACGESYVLEPSQLVCHHKQELTTANVNNPEIALNPSNIEVICKRCHDIKHKRYGYNGKQDVYIVYGAPCSGKTTYVQQICDRGDLIVDINEINHAISGCSMYDNPERIKRQVYTIRDVLIEQIKMRTGNWQNAYVVGGYPRKLEREQLAEKLRAELIYCDVTKDEAKQRALISRGLLVEQYFEYIERYFEMYQA